jgi:transposase-like protein
MECCPRCKETHIVKNGFVGKNQRWRCKGCRFSFTRKEPKSAPKALKLFAITLWQKQKWLSQLAISKLVGYSNVSIGKWLDRTIVETLPLPATVDVIELDELHHYVGKKTRNAGYGLLWMAFPDDCWTGHMVAVGPKRFAPCSKG